MSQRLFVGIIFGGIAVLGFIGGFISGGPLSALAGAFVAPSIAFVLAVLFS